MPVTNNADGFRVQYGRRLTNDEANFGFNREIGPDKYMVAELRGSDFTSGTYTGPTIVVKAGATVREVTAEVLEVFVLGGTTPVINIGVSGTEGTNRFAQLSQAQAQALGTYAITPAGTLAANTPLAADSTINVALGGTSPTVTTAGRVRVYVRYTDATPV
jgi:hypothetical protein